MNPFNLEEQYQAYLTRVKLPEEKMGSIQRSEMRRTFMGAAGQLIVMLRDDLTKLDDVEAEKQLRGMLDQVAEFFVKETSRQN